MSMRCIDLRAGEIYGHQSGGRFRCLWADHGDADLLREDGWQSNGMSDSMGSRTSGGMGGMTRR